MFKWEDAWIWDGAAKKENPPPRDQAAVYFVPKETSAITMGFYFNCDNMPKGFYTLASKFVANDKAKIYKIEDILIWAYYERKE